MLQYFYIWDTAYYNVRQGGAMKVFQNSTEKAILLMELVAMSPSPLSLRDMATQSGIPRSTVHRIIQNLEEAGWVEKDSSQGHYRPGMFFFFLAGQDNPFVRLTSLGIPVMEDLVALTGQTALISVLEGTRGRCVASVPSPHLLQFVAKKGMTFPLNGGATGKMLLAHAPRLLREHFLEKGPWEHYASQTLVTPEELQAERELILRQGYAVSREEFMPRTAALSVPLYEKERFIAQLGISGHLEDFEHCEKTLLPSLLEAAARINRALDESQGNAPKKGMLL